MRLLLVSPEIAPVVKIGGIADGVAGLAKALARAGHDVTVATPRNRRDERAHVDTTQLAPIELDDAPPGGPRASVDLHAATLDHGVKLVLVEIPGVAPELGAYGDDLRDDGGNARRFGLFARAVVALAARAAASGERWPLIHAHEWPAALVPYLARERRADLGAPRLVLTLHTLAHQGIFPPSAMAHVGVGPGHFHPGALEFHGRVNLLKAGLVAADAVTAVSPTYAREILGPEHGELLDGVLRARGDQVVGILNGIDTDVWDPRRDPALPATYGPDDLAGKETCKRALSTSLGLDASRPLVLSLGRVFHQKGSDWLVDAIPAIVAEGACVAVAGTGDPALCAALDAIAAAHPGRVAYVGFAPEDLAHRLLAAADVFVMPSRFEPCGLVQLYAQRYGTAPVARRTGGLVDTIVDASADLAEGTGMLWDEASAAGLVAAVRRALAATRLDAWDALRRRIMRLDVGWEAPARRYERLYARLVATRPRGA
jgi:starch synthase